MSTLNTLYLVLGIFASAIVIIGGVIAVVRFPKTRQFAARIKARIERPRKEREALESRISKLEEDLGTMRAIVSKEMELRFDMGAQVTQVNARIESYVRMLTETREQITDLRRVDAELDTNARRAHREFNARIEHLALRAADPAREPVQLPLADYPPRNGNTTEG